MKLINSLTNLVDAVQTLIQEHDTLKTENLMLLKENTELKGQHLSKEEEVILLKYKNELAKTRIEAIIKRLKAVDQSLADSGTDSLPALLSGQILEHEITDVHEPHDTSELILLPEELPS